VLVHADTDQARERLANSRLAYVSVSRGRYDAQIYTNDARKLGEELGRDVSNQCASETHREMGDRNQGRAVGTADRHSASETQGHVQAEGHSISR
jgi:hypothetical protein